MGPTECKYCGLHATWHIDDDTVFSCGTIYAGRGDYWNESTGCVEIMRSRERIQRAIEVLDDITSDAWEEGLQDATRFLRGNSSKSSNSSPVTADQLAVADYFEAVRQRVPWMTVVKHIEGLVEGYRQCGVPVWQAEEHIQRIYGGWYGQTD